MLGVVVGAVQVSHEPHFTIIREVLPPSKKQQKHAERQASNRPNACAFLTVPQAFLLASNPLGLVWPRRCGNHKPLTRFPLGLK